MVKQSDAAPPRIIKPKSLEVTDEGLLLTYDVTYDTSGPTIGTIMILVFTAGEIGALVAPFADILQSRGFE